MIAKACELLPDDDYYSRACLESVAGNGEMAIKALQVALEQQDAPIDWARVDPNFVFIRDDPRYRALVGLDND